MVCAGNWYTPLTPLSSITPPHPRPPSPSPGGLEAYITHLGAAHQASESQLPPSGSVSFGVDVRRGNTATFGWEHTSVLRRNRAAAFLFTSRS